MALEPPYADLAIPARFRDIAFNQLPPAIQAKLEAQVAEQEQAPAPEPEGEQV